MLKTENFQSILERAKKHYNNLTDSKKKRIKEELDHGKALLDSKDQMKAYVALYGEIHQSKLDRAFNNIPDALLSKISEYLSGKKHPTLLQGKKLSQKLNIDPAIVLGV